MKRIVALVSGFGWHVQDLCRAAPRVGVEFEPVGFETIRGSVGVADRSVEASGTELSQVDGVLVRMMPPGSLEQVVFRMDALHRLSSLGVPLLNPPSAVEAAVDKYLTLAKLEAAGVPVPPTVVTESAADALRAFERIGPDVVVKPLFGSEGRGILRVSDRELAGRAFRTLERLGSVIYLQKCVRHPGHDVRALILGGRVLAAMRREAEAGEWRTNVALGGRATAEVLSDERTGLALRAAEAVGAELAGVDLLQDADSRRDVVLEVNAVPGWRAISRVSGIDVAAEVLGYLRERCR